MKLSPKHIIYISISKYLNSYEQQKLKDELAKYKTLSSMKFIQIIQKHFDLYILRDAPLIPEDIMLFNYLMYDTNKKDKQKLFEIGEKFNIISGLKRTPLFKKYEKTVILPEVKIIIDNIKSAQGLK